MFCVRSLTLRPRTKIALLVLAWVVWSMIAAGSMQVLSMVTVVQAQDFSDMGPALGITDTTGTQGLQQPTPTPAPAPVATPAPVSTPLSPCEQYGADSQQCMDATNPANLDQTNRAIDRAIQNTVLRDAQQNGFDGPAVGGGNFSAPRVVQNPTVTPEFLEANEPVGNTDPTAFDFSEQLIEGFDARVNASAPGTPRPQQFGPSAPSTPRPQQFGPSAPSTPPPQQFGPPAPPAAGNGGAGTGVQLPNPISGISTIPDLLAAILNVVIIIAIPIIIFFLMLAGFKYVTARGNPSTISEASQALLYAIFGGILILGATGIAQLIKGLVNSFRS